MDQEEISKLPEDTVGQRMKKLRLEAGLSQEKLSEFLGFTPNYYGQVERGAKELSKNLASAMCLYFDVSYSYLYQGIKSDKVREEEAYDTSKNHIIRFLRTCTEEECEVIYPILQTLIQAHRRLNRNQTGPESQNGKKRVGRPRKNWPDDDLFT